MEKNLVVFLLCIGLLGSLGWGFYEHHQIKTILDEQVQAEKDRAASANKEIKLLSEQIVQEQKSSAKAQKEATETIKKLSSQLAEHKKAEAIAAGPGSSGADLSTTSTLAMDSIKSKIEKLNAFAGKGMPGKEDAKDASPGKSYMANIGKMMKNPEMRKMVQAQQKPILDMTYGPLYDLLNLPEEQKTQLQNLLADRQNRILDMSFDIMSDELTPEQKNEKQKAIGDLNKEMEKQVETMLGKDNYQVFKTYEETQPERMTVQMFSNGLDSNLQLNEIQKNDLVFEMHKARSDFKFTTGLDEKDKVPDFNSLTPEVLNRHMEESRQLNAKYLEAAGKVMNAQQLEKFRASLEQQQQLQEFGLKMFVSDKKK